ncbi:phosphotransferase family protein [Nocardioides guangzhouensis]|uniref:Phosphotransferase family protein n=1 Tax=Nocardioides guangzhouensis TaxID=2497878 RepID=A0A4Q4Z477_9ACTN|nr:phosphotransferase family protein [Nocardioides guangzhouensis]RYP82055.1 phosphotransferase family protein [Nocardioides guangzhouensis]
MVPSPQDTHGSDAGNPARAVRDEDAFDVDAVAAWLRDHAAPAFAGVVDGKPEVRQFPDGASNLTYLLRYPDGDLILRRPPSGRKAKGAHDMSREFRVQSALAPVFPLVPRMVGFCEDHTVLGSDFYVMERVDGTILRQDFPPGLDLSVRDVSTLCANAVDVLVDLHRVDPCTPGLAEFGKGPGYVDRQVGGWVHRFRQARTEDVGEFAEVTSWLEEHQPEDAGYCPIHNDFRFDNLVLAPDDPLRIVGVLDWEMATLGDPLMDLGCTLAYWVQEDDDEFFHQFRRQPTTAPGMWSRAEVVGYYAEQTGLAVTPEQWRFYEAFGLFRLAVISQQIYYRYFHGQTHNPAYAVFGQATSYLANRARGVIG